MSDSKPNFKHSHPSTRCESIDFGFFLCVCCLFLNNGWIVKLFLMGIHCLFPWTMSLEFQSVIHLLKIQFRRVFMHSFLPNKSIFNLCLEHDREVSTLFELPSHRFGRVRVCLWACSTRKYANRVIHRGQTLLRWLT